jgi:hypothetical protein
MHDTVSDLSDDALATAIEDNLVAFGYPVYRRLGFRPLCGLGTSRRFARPAAESR